MGLLRLNWKSDTCIFSCFIYVFFIIRGAILAPLFAVTCYKCGYLVGVGLNDCNDPFVASDAVNNATCDGTCEVSDSRRTC